MSAAQADARRGTAPDFLVIGHAVQDLPAEGSSLPWRLGGAVSYASTLARKFGLRAGVLTSAGPDMDLDTLLPGVEWVLVPSERSTQIRNMYEGGRRRQQMPQKAAPLTAAHLPVVWRKSPVVLLGPVAGELDDSLAACFPGSIVGVGAQGWLRESGPDSAVRPVAPEAWYAAPVLRQATALFLSDEDVPPNRAPVALQRWSTLVDTVAFTRGYDGADIYHCGLRRHIGAFPAKAVDPTGAGDVFAAAFLIRLKEGADVWDAARFASCTASFVVEGEGVAAVPDRAQVEARLLEHPEIIARE